MNTTNKGPWLVPAWTEASPRLPEPGEPHLLPTGMSATVQSFESLIAQYSGLSDEQIKAARLGWNLRSNEAWQLRVRAFFLARAIRQTLGENAHLADGDNCTLLPLKLALAQINTPAAIEPEPDMFWNADDTEQSHDSVQDLVATAWSNDEAQHGTVLTIQRAVSLADIKVRVVEEEGGNSVTYELVQEDTTTQGELL